MQVTLLADEEQRDYTTEELQWLFQWVSYACTALLPKQGTQSTKRRDITPEIVDESPVSRVKLEDFPQTLCAQIMLAQATVIRKQEQQERNPFILRYLSHIEELSQFDPFDFSLTLYKEILRLASPYYLFTESAMHLFQSVWEPNKHDFPLLDPFIMIEVVTS